MILAGDIGGTKCAIGLFEREPGGGGLRRLRDAVYPSAAQGSLAEVLERFLAEGPAGSLAAAGFGVAGTVIAGRASTTNLAWPEIRADEIARSLGLPEVSLLNDLEATAYGMLVLPQTDFVELNDGAQERPQANRAVIAAGTGLGEAFLVWDGERYLAVAGEGGHRDWAPRNDEEMQLLRFLGREVGGRVSSERVLSGPGLSSLYRFAREESGDPEPAWLARRMAGEDPARVVSSVGSEGSDAACARALRLFVSLYGAEAGNLALQDLAVGGVFVGGGIAPQILPALREGGFLRAFRDKGRFESILAQVSVKVATNPEAALLGAAHHAAAAAR